MAPPFPYLIPLSRIIPLSLGAFSQFLGQAMVPDPSQFELDDRRAYLRCFAGILSLLGAHLFSNFNVNRVQLGPVLLLS